MSIRTWLTRVLDLKPSYRIVEIERPRQQPQLNADVKAALESLNSHPGFRYLLDKLRLQRHMLETQLRMTRHETLRDSDFLQSGIFWTGWLEQQMKRTGN